jgi:hypothetical protein
MMMMTPEGVEPTGDDSGGVFPLRTPPKADFYLSISWFLICTSDRREIKSEGIYAFLGQGESVAVMNEAKGATELHMSPSTWPRVLPVCWALS